MKGSKVVLGLMAGGMLGFTAAVMSVPGYRNMIMKKARSQGKKVLRSAKQIFPL